MIDEPLTQRSLGGARWLMGHRLIVNLIRVATVAVVARHLSPTAFGLVALAQVLLQFTTWVGEAGLFTYVIYDEADGREERAQSAFWLNLVITVVQVGICLAAIPLLTQFFRQDDLRSVLVAVVAIFFIQQLAIVPTALLHRAMQHASLAKRNITVDTLIAGFSIVLAVNGAGVWSLLVPSLVLEPVRMAAAMVLARWRPRLPLRHGQWRQILRFSGPLAATNALNLVSNDGDTLVVGRLMSAATLGFYNVAWQLANIVGRNITAVVTSISLPALGLVRDDLARFRRAYIRVTALLASATFPVLALMFGTADSLIRVVYGPRWSPTILLLRVFLVFTLLRSITSPAAALYNLFGRTDIGLKFTLAFTPAYIAAILVGARWDATGVAVAVTAVRSVGALVHLQLGLHYAKIRFGDFTRAVAGCALLAFVAGSASFVTDRFVIGENVNDVVRLVLSGSIGLAIYVGGLLAVKPLGYEELQQALRSFDRPRWLALRRGRR